MTVRWDDGQVAELTVEFDDPPRGSDSPPGERGLITVRATPAGGPASSARHPASTSPADSARHLMIMPRPKFTTVGTATMSCSFCSSAGVLRAHLDHRPQQDVPAPQGLDDQAGALDQLGQAVPVVAAEVPGRHVVLRPQRHVARHRDQRRAARPQHPPDLRRGLVSSSMCSSTSKATRRSNERRAAAARGRRPGSR